MLCPVVLWCLPFIGMSRLRERRSWVVSFSISRPFGPSRVVRATQVFERQQNALLGAAQRDDVVAIKNILQSGAAVSYANSVGQTALHIATLWGNASAVEALVQAGAAVDQVNDLGAQTPLHLLASRVGKQSNTANRILCAKTLIKAGCDLGKKNEDGVMAYQYLNGEEGDDVVELRKLITPF